MARKLSNWLQAYREYTDGTESPDSFHLWSGIGALAAAAQRKIYMKLGHITVHSNLFAVLTGPSGGPKKSTALEIARDIVRGLDVYGIKPNLGPQKASGAALISRLCQIEDKSHQSITAFVLELGTLLGSHDAEMADTITSLWDCSPDWDKDTISRGGERAAKPWLNIISATTPTWLADNLPPTALEAGLVSRGIFVYEEEERGRVPRPKFTKRQEELGPLLKHDLAEIWQLKGEFTFEEEGAGTFYDQWYMDKKNFKPIEPRLISFYRRKHVHVCKTAMLLSLAESNSLVIELRHIKSAIALIESIEPDMSKAFLGIGKNIHSMDYERIKRHIQTEGRVYYKSIVGAYINSVSIEAINSILKSLVDAEEVKLEGQVFVSQNGKH